CGSIADAENEADLYAIVTALTTEDAEPLPIEIITAPMGSFPLGARVNRLDLFVSAAVGNSEGPDPIETTPKMDIFISKDLGISWSSPWSRQIGPQGLSPNVWVNNMGLCGPKGIK